MRLAIVTNVDASVGVTPNSRALITLVNVNAPDPPIARPSAVRTSPRGRTCARCRRPARHRDADADVPATLRNHVRHHAVDADNGQHECHTGKEAEQNQIETRCSKPSGTHIGHRADAGHRQCRRQPSKLASYDWRQHDWMLVGADHQVRRTAQPGRYTSGFTGATGPSGGRPRRRR